MRITVPDIPDSARLSLSEAARVLECTRATVRVNSERFKIHPRVNEKTRKTIYSGAQVKKLWYSMT